MNFGFAMHYYLSESENPSLGGRVDKGSAVVSGEFDARMPMSMGVEGDPAGALTGGMTPSWPHLEQVVEAYSLEPKLV
jgi:hypothetical protein